MFTLRIAQFYIHKIYLLPTQYIYGFQKKKTVIISRTVLRWSVFTARYGLNVLSTIPTGLRNLKDNTMKWSCAGGECLPEDRRSAVADTLVVKQ